MRLVTKSPLKIIIFFFFFKKEELYKKQVFDSVHKNGITVQCKM